MRATRLVEPHRIAIRDVPDPRLDGPADAIVRVLAAGICGSDLWGYRGLSPREPEAPIGHELVGIVEQVGDDVTSVHPGDFVVAPFRTSDGTCPNCARGFESACLHGATWGFSGLDGGQGERVRVPYADGTLVRLPEDHPEALSDDRLADYLALADVYPTGLHAATMAGVRPGGTAVVVGDGAVGLSATLAATRLGADRVIVLGSRHADRNELSGRAGASEVHRARGDEAVDLIERLTDGLGADWVLECVGTGESFETGLRLVRPGGVLSYVGIPHGVHIDMTLMFRRDLTITGGMAPARRYIPQLVDDVRAGLLRPGFVFTTVLPLASAAEGYALMDQRRTVKVMLKP